MSLKIAINSEKMGKNLLHDLYLISTNTTLQTLNVFIYININMNKYKVNVNKKFELCKKNIKCIFHSLLKIENKYRVRE